MIIEDYFNTLKSKLKRYDPKISKEISEYVKMLVKIDQSIINKSIEAISDAIFNPENKSQIYNSINKAIRKIRKQIIVCIDDLDRLDKKEIIEVIRLIRNTANFDNVIYIVAYDKNYILEAIKEFNVYNYKSFLEKIFQFEFFLPNCPPGILSTQLKKTLKQQFDDAFHSQIEIAIDYRNITGISFTNEIIKTKRDVVRLCNSLLFEIGEITNDINFIDFYLIQLLKVRFYEVYEFIAIHRNSIFIKEGQKIRLRKINEKNISNDQINFIELFENHNSQNNKIEPDKFLFDNYILTLKLSEVEQGLIINLVKELFTEKSYEEGKNNFDVRSFANYNNMNYYFNIQLFESDIPFGKLESLRMKAYNDYRDLVFQLIDDGHLSEITDYLEKIVDFFNKEEWEQQLNILVEVGKYTYKTREALGINYSHIIKILNYPKQGINKYKFFNTETKYRKYINEFFKKAPDPYVFESKILSITLNLSIQFLGMNDEEITEQLFTYFKTYCKAHNEIDNNFRELYRNCLEKSNDNHELVIQERAKKLFVTYYKKYLKESDLTRTFIQQVSPESEYFDMKKDWIKVFFPNMKDFEKYLGTASNLHRQAKSYNEFIDFYQQYKDNKFKPIKFNFQYSEPSIWN